MHDGENRVYGKFRVDELEPFNAKDMGASRLAFADRKRFDQILEEELNGRVPFCAKCDANPELTYGLKNVLNDLIHYDRLGIFNPQVFERLTEWPMEGRFELKDKRKNDHGEYLLDLLRNTVGKALTFSR